MNNRVDKYSLWLANANANELSLFIARYEYWLSNQLKEGGLVFTPSDYWLGFEQKGDDNDATV